jgi:hypothetical protein
MKLIVDHLEKIKETNWRIDVDESNINCGSMSECDQVHEERALSFVSEERIWMSCSVMI